MDAWFSRVGRRFEVASLVAAVSFLLLSCAATGGSSEMGAPTVVRFSYEAVSPQTVHIATGGNVTWQNVAPDSRGTVVFPASIASAFTCGDKLDPYFRKTQAGYESLPITDYESERVELPCALRPGSYPYEIRILGTGLGEAWSPGADRTLRGTLVVE